jgi:hypothetical protein
MLGQGVSVVLPSAVKPHPVRGLIVAIIMESLMLDTTAFQAV